MHRSRYEKAQHPHNCSYADRHNEHPWMNGDREVSGGGACADEVTHRHPRVYGGRSILQTHDAVTHVLLVY